MDPAQCSFWGRRDHEVSGLTVAAAFSLHAQLTEELIHRAIDRGCSD
jgi:hypothetical protein